MTPDEPLLDVARGDAARSAHLRECLRLLRDRSPDPAFRALADDVLAGRRSLRDAAAAPAFDRVVAPGVQAFAERWRELPEEERRRVAAQGEAQLADLRARLDGQRRTAARRPGHDEPDDEPDDVGPVLRPVW